MLASITLSSAVAFAACGGDGSAEPPATSAAVVNTAPSTILAPATTPAPTTTEPAGTVTTTQAPTVETTAPMREEEQAKQAVIEAAEHAWWVFNEAKLDPTNDEKVQSALSAFTGAARERVDGILRQYRTEGWRSLTSEIIPASVEVNSDSVDVNLANRTATVSVCIVNSNMLVDSDEADDVLDDSISAFRAVENYTFENGGWLQTSGVADEAIEGAIACASGT